MRGWSPGLSVGMRLRVNLDSLPLNILLPRGPRTFNAPQRTAEVSVPKTA